MRDALLTLLTVLKLSGAEIWSRWRSPVWLAVRWLMAFALMAVTLLWVTFVVDQTLAENAHPSKTFLIVLAGVNAAALVGLFNMVRASSRHRYPPLPFRQGARLAVTDPFALLDFTVQPALEMAVDGRGIEQWKGLTFLMLQMAGAAAYLSVFVVALIAGMAMTGYEALMGSPTVRATRRQRRRAQRTQAAQRRAEQRAVRARQGSALQRWQRSVLDRHPDAARELEGRILRHAMPHVAKDQRAPRSRL